MSRSNFGFTNGQGFGMEQIPAAGLDLFVGETLFTRHPNGMMREYVGENSPSYDPYVTTNYGKRILKSNVMVEKALRNLSRFGIKKRCKKSLVNGHMLLRNKRNGRFCKKSKKSKKSGKKM